VTAAGRRLRRLRSAIGGSPPIARLASALGLAALLGGTLFAVAGGAAAQSTIVARFATAPGLYPGNNVDVLGLPVGKVTAVRPGPRYVTVDLSVPASLAVPARAHAVIMAPQVVNDRYVQLAPAYDGGPRLGDHAVIPVSRTDVPISVDQIVDSLDQLARALGPNGVNAHGALSALVASSARTFGGNGTELHAALTSLGSALGALSAHSPALTALFDNLGHLSQVASQYTSTYQAFANNLAVVSTDLAADDNEVGPALTELQHALAALAQFTVTNASALAGSVTNLRAFAGAVAADQQGLAQVYADLPNALDDLRQAVDPNAPGGPALRARLDPMTGSAGFAQSVCGNPLLRLLLLSIDRAQDTNPPVDLGCGVDGLLAGLPTPPDASPGPSLSLGALTGRQP
jgi:virulence factor Mce-like protein